MPPNQTKENFLFFSFKINDTQDKLKGYIWQPLSSVLSDIPLGKCWIENDFIWS